MGDSQVVLSYVVRDGKLHVLGHTFDLSFAPRYVRASLTADFSMMQLWGSADNAHWRLLQEQVHRPARLIFPRPR